MSHKYHELASYNDNTSDSISNTQYINDINYNTILSSNSELDSEVQLSHNIDNNFLKLEKLSVGWDGYKAQIPNSDSLDNAKKFSRLLLKNNIISNSILASVMGGVIIRISARLREVFIEFYNNGKILVMKNDKTTQNDQPSIFSIDDSSDDFEYAIKQIQGFLYFDYPDRMYSNNHRILEDQIYSDSESLYFRFPKSYFINTDNLELGAINVPNMSCNRYKYGGKPEDVLCGYYSRSDGTIVTYIDWGVAEFKVSDIPNPLLWRAIPFYSKAVHIPERKNYYHTEIQSFDSNKNPIEARGAYSEEILMLWREKLRNRLKTPIIPGSLFNSN
ncbi:hypothetical protein K9N50_01910 [bacterium]|nr:hypothetical protein [bacterium]